MLEKLLEVFFFENLKLLKVYVEDYSLSASLLGKSIHPQIPCTKNLSFRKHLQENKQTTKNLAVLMENKYLSVTRLCISAKESRLARTVVAEQFTTVDRNDMACLHAVITRIYVSFSANSPFISLVLMT